MAVSLVKRKATSFVKCDSFWIHPLVQQWARERVNDQEQRKHANEAISLITTVIITDSPGRTAEYLEFERRISNHIDLGPQNIFKYYHCAKNEDTANISNTLYTLGIIEYYRGCYDRSAECFQRALDGYETALGKHHPATLATIHEMAVVFNAKGSTTRRSSGSSGLSTAMRRPSARVTLGQFLPSIRWRA